MHRPIRLSLAAKPRLPSQRFPYVSYGTESTGHDPLKSCSDPVLVNADQAHESVCVRNTRGICSFSFSEFFFYTPNLVEIYRLPFRSCLLIIRGFSHPLFFSLFPFVLTFFSHRHQALVYWIQAGSYRRQITKYAAKRNVPSPIKTPRSVSRIRKAISRERITLGRFIQRPKG